MLYSLNVRIANEILGYRLHSWYLEEGIWCCRSCDEMAVASCWLEPDMDGFCGRGLSYGLSNLPDFTNELTGTTRIINALKEMKIPLEGLEFYPNQESFCQACLDRVEDLRRKPKNDIRNRKTKS